MCLMILLANCGCPDQIARMHRLIWALAVRMCPKTPLRTAHSTCQICFRHLSESRVCLALLTEDGNVQTAVIV